MATSGKQKRPTGRSREMTDDWKARVREELKERGEEQQWLAGKTGATPAGISTMLNPATATSKYVDATCEVLGIPPPMVAVRDERALEWNRVGVALRELDPIAFDKLLARANKTAELSEQGQKSGPKLVK